MLIDNGPTSEARHMGSSVRKLSAYRHGPDDPIPILHLLPNVKALRLEQGAPAVCSLLELVDRYFTLKGLESLHVKLTTRPNLCDISTARTQPCLLHLVVTGTPPSIGHTEVHLITWRLARQTWLLWPNLRSLVLGSHTQIFSPTWNITPSYTVTTVFLTELRLRYPSSFGQLCLDIPVVVTLTIKKVVGPSQLVIPQDALQRLEQLRGPPFVLRSVLPVRLGVRDIAVVSDGSPVQDIIPVIDMARHRPLLTLDLACIRDGPGTTGRLIEAAITRFVGEKLILGGCWERRVSISHTTILR